MVAWYQNTTSLLQQEALALQQHNPGLVSLWNAQGTGYPWFGQTSNSATCYNNTTATSFWYNPNQFISTSSSTGWPYVGPYVDPYIGTYVGIGDGYLGAVETETIGVGSPAVMRHSREREIEELYQELTQSYNDSYSAQTREEHELRSARLAAELEARQTRANEVAQASKAAHDRANELLLSNLTPAQRETIKQHGWFIVEGGKTKKPYRIYTGTIAGNIVEMEGERPRARICCHIPSNLNLPRPDNTLAQKLMLEANEDEFLRLANRTMFAA